MIFKAKTFYIKVIHDERPIIIMFLCFPQLMQFVSSNDTVCGVGKLTSYQLESALGFEHEKMNSIHANPPPLRFNNKWLLLDVK